jgi:O-antigen/teichoic acid export membrane protein
MSLLHAGQPTAWERVAQTTARSWARMKGARGLVFKSVAALAIFVLGSGLSFVAQFGAARLLGVDAFGQFAYVCATVTLLASVSTLGFHVALLRLLPAFSSRGEWGLARGVFRFAHVATVLASAAVAVLACAVASMFTRAADGALLHAFWIGFAAIPFLALQLVSSAATRAFGGVALALAPERLVRDGSIVLLIGAAALGGVAPMSATTGVTAFLLSALATALFAGLAARHLRPPVIASASPVYEPASWMRLAPPLTILTLADNLMARSGVLALGLAGLTREAGVFAVAVGFAQLSALPRMAVATMFAPTVSGLHASGDRAGVQALATRSSWLSLFGALCVAIPLLLLLPLVLPTFGPGFEHGVTAAIILILSQIFCAACGPQQHLLTMTGHERAGALLLSIAAVSAFAASLLAVRDFGAIGAATAMAIAQVGWNLAMARFIRDRLQVRPGALPSSWIHARDALARRSCDA